MTKTVPAIIVFAALAAAPTLAADHVFVVTNRTQAAVTSIVVRGGEIADFQRVPSNGQRNLTLRLPDGVCETRLTFAFDDSDSIVVNTYDACNSGGIDLD